ncbi:TonB-dependent receptor domain-containing protein [Roseivirga sp. BDSF3-8]|uniref:TonB-dependent receptor n=1 Tax=Roseivirga sp. BDSF3-8 TaxID=3241598 RepID=UPI003531BEB2
MKSLYLSLLLLLFAASTTLAQSLVAGTITDTKGESLPGASVYLQGTYDGASTDSLGTFGFQTSEEGELTLIISSIGYHGEGQSLTLPGNHENLRISLKEDISQMEEVVITAGAYQATDESRAVALKPMDIVTTAGALGDISGAIRKLPGTQPAADDGRLLVRGGTSSESRIYIDGMSVQSPFATKLPALPTRGRFNPFLFKGITFSSGGYSAEYGQALSSVLILNTKDRRAVPTTEISLMTVGAGAAHEQPWKRGSLALRADYTNLQPYQGMMNSERDWQKAPRGWNGQLSLQQETGAHGLWKTFAQYSSNKLAFRQKEPFPGVPDALNLKNDYFYGQTGWSGRLSDTWKLRGGVSGSYNLDDFITDLGNRRTERNGLHAKLVAEHHLPRLSLTSGTEWLADRTVESLSHDSLSTSSEVQSHTTAVFTEAQYRLSGSVSARAGLRYQHMQPSGSHGLSPRLGLAWQAGEHSQLSAAYGTFYQQAEAEYLLAENSLAPYEAAHYILNYQWNKSDRLLRVETYYKSYDRLTRTLSGMPENTGEGFAKGAELFWRDRETVKNLDYWVSYSYTDTERTYSNFPVAATPTFVSKHVVSVVGKYFVRPIRTQFGTSIQYASGRPYDNPATEAFMDGRTKPIFTIDLNAAHLISDQVVLFASVTNLLGYDQVFGYRYADTPGGMLRQAIRPDAPRFVFAGLFITLEKKSTEELLNQF